MANEPVSTRQLNIYGQLLPILITTSLRIKHGERLEKLHLSTSIHVSCGSVFTPHYSLCGIVELSPHNLYTPLLIPAIPPSPIASNYPLNEQWAPLALYGKRAPLRRKLRGQHKHAKRKRTVGNAKRRTRSLCLSPRALANWF